jgi:hypothetical protein
VIERWRHAASVWIGSLVVLLVLAGGPPAEGADRPNGPQSTAAAKPPPAANGPAVTGSAQSANPLPPYVPEPKSAPPAPGGDMQPKGGAQESIERSSLEDLLLKKGVISIEDWIGIKAEEERRAVDRTVVAEFSGSPRWFERVRHYGYGQFRWNRLGQPNQQLRSFQDSSIGDNQGFFFRRIRYVVTGQMSEHVSVFFQPDFASNISNNTHSVSMRDMYGDLYFDRDKEFRLRVGLQRVPCSFDNYQASRVRMAIARADATNSCSTSERDMGIAFMWSPKEAQARYKRMLDYMYGPGDYGVFNVTVYNGQTLNKAEANDNKHVGLHLGYPFELPGGQLMEVGMNAMRGQFHVNHGSGANFSTTLFSLNPSLTTSGMDYRDERVNLYVYYPPQPWGFLAEYVTGRGPQRGSDGIVRERALHGGYVQGHYQHKYSDTGLVNFYSRFQAYRGGIKSTTGAPDGTMQELETGIAWEPDPQWEFTLAYSFTERMNDAVSNLSSASGCTGSGTLFTCTPGAQLNAYGNLVRFQVNFFFN